MDPILARQITIFFRHPLEAPKITQGHPETLSVLFLLRRDIQGCLSASKYLIPATMTILAGIDLLGKFYAGDDDRGGVTRRFKGFLRTHLSITEDEINAIYALRNALMHSFSLYSEGNEFMLAERLYSDKLILTEPNNTLIISISMLYSFFEDAIDKYQSDLMGDETLQQNFSRMFQHYGLTHVGIG